MRVLAVIGRPQTEQELVAHLRSKGHLVENAYSESDALEYVKRYEFDAVVLLLQVTVPEFKGQLRRLRTVPLYAPIIVLVPTVDTQARVALLEAGADDIMALPLDRAELDARLHALLRRSRGHSQQTLSMHGVSFSLDSRMVSVNGSMLSLTAKETAVLELLMLRCDSILSKNTFLRHIYPDIDLEPSPQIIDVFVFRLRRKLSLAGAPNFIRTVWGRGFVARNATLEAREAIKPLDAAAIATAAT